MVALAKPPLPELDDRVRRFTRSEYAQLIGLGLFEGERVELIQGVLFTLSPQYPPHASTVDRLTELLVPRLKGRFRVRIQLPLALSEASEPEPDIAVVALGNYDRDHPTSARLVIEVSESSLKRDRIKAGVYASAGIAEYWIVNLDARTVEVHLSPAGDRYAEVRTVGAGETLHPAGLDVALTVAEILPKE